jgi:hypothetical protein
MPDVQVLPDSISACADAVPPFECSRAEGSLDAAWVHVATHLTSRRHLGWRGCCASLRRKLDWSCSSSAGDQLGEGQRR